ncbi:MAG: LPS assembly lipoprotein LptE [Planctomycetota bacterium]
MSKALLSENSNITMRFFTKLLAASIITIPLGGCYTTGLKFPPHVRKIAVPVFHNDSYTRGVELDLTDRIRELIIDMSDVQLVINESAADAVLRGEITRVDFPVLVGGNEPRILEGSAVVSVSAVLVDSKTNKTIARTSGEDRAEFTTTLGESRKSAVKELVDTLAWRIVLGLSARSETPEP